MKEVEHVIGIFEKARKAVSRNDYLEIKMLSNQVIHSASVYQDSDNILVAIVLYSLSKIIERGERYYKENYIRYLKHYLDSFDKIILFLKKEDYESFREQVKSLVDSKEIADDLKHHVKDIFRKARINKAGKVYEHGLSMKKTAKLLGISLWELAEYSGQSNVGDMDLSKTMGVGERVDFVKEMFQ
jgi:hypothetical protein